MKYQRNISNPYFENAAINRQEVQYGALVVKVVKYILQSFDLEVRPSNSAAILLSECMKKEDGFRCLNQTLISR